MKTTLITGGAGFIGSSLIDQLLEENPHYAIINLDNFDTFYSKEIKQANIRHHLNYPNYQLLTIDINDAVAMNEAFKEIDIDCIVHLAAKAGVRPSIQDPQSYFQTNVMGTLNLLELAKQKKIKKFVFASSSSVYGKNPNVPWRESDLDLEPISPYAASKIAAEKVCQTYAHLYGLDITALRFFTVYGPKQRPDLAIHKFFKLAMNNQPIPFFGDGSTRRDYTYVADIVQGIKGAMNFKNNGFEVFNLGNHQTVSLKELVDAIGNVLGKEILLDKQPKQAGDVDQTYADIDKAMSKLGYSPKTKLIDGLSLFIKYIITKK
ncbi:MAG: GDP-mannose 4,6-dehydratase [Bacteroidota bacterium]|nr:GDP-mannose 4,6-dehydratase [Bacteroidota bacterium]